MQPKVATQELPWVGEQNDSNTNGVAPSSTAGVTAKSDSEAPRPAPAASPSAESPAREDKEPTPENPLPARPHFVPDVDYDEFKEAFAKLKPEELLLRYYGDE